MIVDPWVLVLVRTAEGSTVPVRVWLPPLPGAPGVAPTQEPAVQRAAKERGQWRPNSLACPASASASRGA